MKNRWFCFLLASCISSAALSESMAPWAEEMLNRGEASAYIARLKTLSDKQSAQSLIDTGNQLFPIDPLAALEMHEAAAVLADSAEVQLELAYDYTVLGRCKEANKAWKKHSAGAALTGAHGAIAAYCLLEQGAVDAAISAWRSARYSQNHTGIEELISSTFGDIRPALRIEKGWKRYQQLGWSHSGDWVINAFHWKLDWWNEVINREAIQIMMKRLAVRKDLGAQKELSCALEIHDAEEHKRMELLKRCGLIVNGGKLPYNTGVAYTISTVMPELDFAQIYKLHRKELWRRSVKEKDLEALKLLSFLASTANDKAELAKVDLLGWNTLGYEVSAVSYVSGLLSAPDPSESPVLALDRALNQFPNHSMLRMFKLRDAKASGAELKQQLVALILAEYHQFNYSSALSALPNARGLNSFFAILAVLRKLEAEGKQPSLEDLVP